MVYEKICPVRGKYNVMDRNELLRFFLTQRRKNLNICKNCKKNNCYSCNKINFIKSELERNAFFSKDLGPMGDAMPRQPVLWQVFDNYQKKPNTLFKNEFKFRIFIEKKVFSYHLVKKYDFLDNKIIEIYNDE